MKTISPELKAHMAQQVTTMCTCWKLVRQDGTTLGFTNNTSDLTYDGVLYEAATGFTPSNISASEDLAVDNMEVVGLLDSQSISRDDLLAGEYDGAQVYIFMVNYEDLTMGDLKLASGTLGEVSIGKVTFEAELRGLAQQLDQTIGEVFSVTCRADLGDARCGLLISPDRWTPRTLVSSGDYVRATLANATNRKFKVTTGGYTGSQEPSWNTTLLGSTNGVATEAITDGTFDAAKTVNWNGGTEWSITSGIASCDGTQVSNSSLTQASSLVVALVSGTPYDTSFDILNYSAGQVRIVINGTPGTWRSANGTFTEELTASSLDEVSIEADSSFIGDIDNVSVIEKVDVVYETEESYLDVGAVTAVNSNENFEDSSRTEADNYYDRGLLTFTSGNNIGKSLEIKVFESDTFQMVLPFPYDIQVGDTYELYRGCDKTFATCRDTFDNAVNFRGEPHIPGNDEISKFGGQ